jgi:N-acetylmuramoyl-L-alanine amidase
MQCYKNEYYGTGVVENLDVRPSQRNAETAAKECNLAKAKLNTESADTKKQLLNKILHKSFFLQISASGRKWIWNLGISKD